MNRRPNSPEGNAAVGRRIAQHVADGARMPLQRVTGRRWPAPTPTAAQRLEAWRQRYQATTIEQQTAPLGRTWGNA